MRGTRKCVPSRRQIKTLSGDFGRERTEGEMEGQRERREKVDGGRENEKVDTI
jgi:hypothetical protein